MKKKIIKIGGVEYYELNGGVRRVRDIPEDFGEAADKAKKELSSAFKSEVPNASDNGDRLQIRPTEHS